MKMKKIDPNSFAIGVGTLGALVGLSLLVYHVFSVGNQSNENLYVRNLTLVHVLFRHGARNPTVVYNSDPYKNFDWPGGLGQLTNTGKTQLYTLGKKFRRQYSGFLPEIYSYNDIHVVSSDIPRTLSSAYVFLAGLYPPKKDQVWNHNLMWQPIPVHSIPRHLDNMIALKRPCKVVDTQYNELMASEEINADYAHIFSNLSYHFNDSIKTVLDLEMIYSTWLIEQEYNLQLPDWVYNYFPQSMKNATCESFRVYSYNTLIRKLRGGVILSNMIKNMKNKLEGTLKPDRKMFIYSGHDLTLTALLKTLGFEECILPEYGASIVLELRTMSTSNTTEVKLVYYSNPNTNPRQLKIPNCGEPCTMEEFTNITQAVLPDNWEEECTVAATDL